MVPLFSFWLPRENWRNKFMRKQKNLAKSTTLTVRAPTVAEICMSRRKRANKAVKYWCARRVVSSI